MRKLVQWLLSSLVLVVYRAYQAEGLNALFMILPAKYLAPLLRKYGAQIGQDVELHTPIKFHNVSSQAGQHYAKLQIGPESYVGRDVFFDLADQVIIENRVTISMRVTL